MFQGVTYMGGYSQSPGTVVTGGIGKTILSSNDDEFAPLEKLFNIAGAYDYF